jgi:hypothetical protein
VGSGKDNPNLQSPTNICPTQPEVLWHRKVVDPAFRSCPPGAQSREDNECRAGGGPETNGKQTEKQNKKEVSTVVMGSLFQ